MAILQTSSDLSDCFFEKLEIIFEIDWRKKIEISSNTFREKSFKVILGEKVKPRPAQRARTKVTDSNWREQLLSSPGVNHHNAKVCGGFPVRKPVKRLGQATERQETLGKLQ